MPPPTLSFVISRCPDLRLSPPAVDSMTARRFARWPPIMPGMRLPGRYYSVDVAKIGEKCSASYGVHTPFHALVPGIRTPT